MSPTSGALMAATKAPKLLRMLSYLKHHKTLVATVAGYEIASSAIMGLLIDKLIALLESNPATFFSDFFPIVVTLESVEFLLSSEDFIELRLFEMLASLRGKGSIEIGPRSKRTGAQD